MKPKTCKHCGENNQDEFYAKSWMCKSCRSKQAADRYKNEPGFKEAAHARTRAFRKTPKGKEATKRTHAKYRSTAAGRAKEKAWQQSEKGKASMSASWHRRRAKLLSVVNTLTAKQWRNIKNSYSNICVYCGEKGKMTQDHLVPLEQGGEHSENNVVPACQSCNSSKRDRTMIVWMAGRV